MNVQPVPANFRDVARRNKKADLIAEYFGVTPRTIGNWFKRAGIEHKRPNAVDHAKLTDLITQGKSKHEIMAILGCSKSVVNDHKRKMGLGSTRVTRRTYGPEVHVEAREPYMPLSDRIERKRRNMHLNHEQFNVWINGVAGKQFMDSQRGIPA
jgi:hypothetical protein